MRATRIIFLLFLLPWLVLVYFLVIGFNRL